MAILWNNKKGKERDYKKLEKRNKEEGQGSWSNEDFIGFSIETLNSMVLITVASEHAMLQVALSRDNLNVLQNS